MRAPTTLISVHLLVVCAPPTQDLDYSGLGGGGGKLGGGRVGCPSRGDAEQRGRCETCRGENGGWGGGSEAGAGIITSVAG